MGFIIMVALSPAVNKLETKIKSRIASIIIAYVVMGLIISSILAFLLPPLAKQLLQLLKELNIPYLQDEIANLKFGVQELNQFAEDYGNSISALFEIIMSTFRSLFAFLTLFVISFYLMIDEPELHLKLGWFTQSKKHIKIFKQFLQDLQNQLGGWVRGEIILMSAIAVLTYVVLSLLQVPFALPLSLLAGLLEILPNIGPTLSAVPAVAIAFLNGDYLSALTVTAAYFLIQFFENNVLVPRILKANADVNPLVTMLSILIGFKLYDVIGGLLAIPVYIILRTIFSYWREYKQTLRPDW
jgi:predicted PurR-regulated permease PerM